MHKRGYLAYYRQKMHGGRNAFARAFDFIALRFAIFAACYVWFLLQTGIQWLTIGLSFIVVLMVSICAHMFERVRLDKFMQKTRDGIRKRILLEQIVLSDITPYIQMLCKHLEKAGMVVESKKGGMIFAKRGNQPVLACLLSRLSVSPVGAQDLLQLFRYAKAKGAELLAFSSSGYTEEALGLLERLPKGHRVRLFSSDRLLELARQDSLLPDDETIDRAVELEIEKEQAHFKRLRSAALLPAKVKRYLVIALIIFAASFVTGYQIYYATLSGLCLCLAGFSWWASRQTLGEQETESL